MAQIPMGNFGYAQAAVKGSSEVSTRVEDNSSLKIANVIGDAVQGITKDFKDSIDLQAKISANTKRNKASVNANEYETKLQAAELDLERQHAEGAIGSDALLPAWEDTAKKLKEEITPFADELDDETRAEYMQRLESVRVNGLARFQGSALNAVKKDNQSSTLEAYDTFRKANLGNAAAADAWLDGEGGQQIHQAFGADAPEMVRKFKEQASLDSVTMAITKAGDDPAALAQVQQQLSTKEAQMRLDPDRLLAINSSLSGRIDSLNERAANKAEANQYKAERRAELSYNETMKHIANGGIVAPETIANLEATTKGTVYEGATKIALQTQKETQDFLRRPEAEQRVILASERAKFQREGSTPDQLTHINNLQSLADERAKQRKESPFTAHEIESGEQPTYIDLSAPDKINHEDLDARLAQREIMTKKGGDVGLLKPEEKDSMVKALKSAKPEQKAQYLSSLATSVDKKTYGLIMRDLYGSDPVASHAGQIAATGTPAAAETSFRLLHGQSLLTDPATKDLAPSEKQFDEAIQYQVGNAFAGAAPQYAQARQSVSAMYMSLAEEAGYVGSTANPDIMKTAVERTLGNVIELNDQKVIAPYGMTAEDFKDKAQASWDALGAETPFDNISLLPAGNGRYLAAKGQTPIMRRGKPVYLDVK